MDKLSIIKVLKLFSDMGATPSELVKEFIKLVVDKEYATKWRDPSWVLPDTDPDRMKAIIIGKYLIDWSAGWKVQPENRFRIGLSIYVVVFKLGYLVIAKKA